MALFLIGYMASGKTTLGRVLAKKLGWQFYDLDFYIEQRFRRSVAEIFAERGEEGFRLLESTMLREVGEMEQTVVACGGGTPCFCDNMRYMLGAGTTVWLDATVGAICRRLLVARNRRPIVEGKSPEELPQFIAGHLAGRLPYYQQARIRIPSDHLESRSEIRETVAGLREILKL